MVLMNVATRAHMMAVDEARRAARRTGDPLMPGTASTAAEPTVATVAPAHALVVGNALPPGGSDMATKRASCPDLTVRRRPTT